MLFLIKLIYYWPFTLCMHNKLGENKYYEAYQIVIRLNVIYFVMIKKLITIHMSNRKSVQAWQQGSILLYFNGFRASLHCKLWMEVVTHTFQVCVCIREHAYSYYNHKAIADLCFTNVDLFLLTSSWLWQQTLSFSSINILQPSS